jgi:hypothetical protein
LISVKHGLYRAQPGAPEPVPSDWRDRYRQMLHAHVARIEAALASMPAHRLRSIAMLDKLLDGMRQMRALDAELAEAQPEGASRPPLTDGQCDDLARAALARVSPRLVDIDDLGAAVRARSDVCEAVYSEAHIVGSLLAHRDLRRRVLGALVRMQLTDPELQTLDDDAEDGAALDWPDSDDVIIEEDGTVRAAEPEDEG